VKEVVEAKARLLCVFKVERRLRLEEWGSEKSGGVRRVGEDEDEDGFGTGIPRKQKTTHKLIRKTCRFISVIHTYTTTYRISLFASAVSEEASTCSFCQRRTNIIPPSVRRPPEPPTTTRTTTSTQECPPCVPRAPLHRRPTPRMFA